MPTAAEGKSRWRAAPWLAVILIAVLLALGFKWLSNDPLAPRFELVDEDVPVGPYDVVHYKHLPSGPFQGDRLWITGHTGTSHIDVFLFDIETERIVGRLSNADPDFMNAEQTKLVCRQRNRPAADSPRAKVADMVFKISRGRLDYRRGGNDEETIWIVDLEKNRSKRIGAINQLRDLSTFFHPSPDFKHGYIKPTVIAPANEMRICDLETGKLEQHTPAGWPMGWWDDQQIILRNSGHEFVLYDSVSRDVRVLFSPRQLSDFFDEHELDEDSRKFEIIPVGNGPADDMYLTDVYKSRLATNSTMIRIDRETEGLELLQKDFKHEWLGRLHANGELYLFDSGESGQGSSPLHIRNLRSGEETDLNATSSFSHVSAPHFFGDEIIYQRSNSLWRVDLKGVNHRQIFPPR